MHWRTVERKNKLEKIDFEELGDNLGLTSKQIVGVFRRFYTLKQKALKWVEISFLSDTMKTLYIEIIQRRYGRIF